MLTVKPLLKDLTPKPFALSRETCSPLGPVTCPLGNFPAALSHHSRTLPGAPYSYHLSQLQQWPTL